MDDRDDGDGAPEIREPVIWALMWLGVDIPRSLSTRRSSAHGNYWLGVGARVRGLLVIPRLSQEVHDKGPHADLTRDEMRESCCLNCFLDRILNLKVLIENELSKYISFLLKP